MHGDVVAADLASCGLRPRAQIIWAKQHFVLSRGHYHWKHECCWYAVRDGKTGHWQGDRTQTTVWDIANNNAEQWIKKGKGAIKWTRLSCRTFAANAVRIQLHALAYNLGNFMRTLAMPRTVQPWSLTSLREKLIKIGAKVVSHGRYVTFQMAEVAVSRQTLADLLSLIARLRAPPAPASGSKWIKCGRQRRQRCAWISPKSARFTVPVLSTAGFNRLLLAFGTICRCPSRSKERSRPRNRGNLVNVG
jgi:hypothetical protein